MIQFEQKILNAMFFVSVATSQQDNEVCLSKWKGHPKLGGGFQHFLFSCLPGKIIQFD